MPEEAVKTCTIAAAEPESRTALHDDLVVAAEQRVHLGQERYVDDGRAMDAHEALGTERPLRRLEGMAHGEGIACGMHGDALALGADVFDRTGLHEADASAPADDEARKPRARSGLARGQPGRAQQRVNGIRAQQERAGVARERIGVDQDRRERARAMAQ